LLNKVSIEDIKVSGKRALVRVDFNVPLIEDKVRDDSRIRAALPTINYLLARKARLAIASHLGRPKGEIVAELKMNPVAERLSDLIDRPVHKLDQVIGPDVEKAVKTMKEGEIILLENLRFEKGEENNDPDFARLMAAPFDLFVNDAFGTAHRAHASTVGVADYIPAVAGLLMKKEIEALSRCLDEPGRPMTAMLGGAKVSDKISVIRRFLSIADTLLVGGGMANTFLAAAGNNLGASFYEKELVAVAAELIAASEKGRCQLCLPLDLVVTRELEPGSSFKIVAPEEITDDWKAVDIGPKTVARYAEIIGRSEMIVWNGPMGVFEVPPYDRGTTGIAEAIAASEAYSVVGGGDLVAALKSLNLLEKISFVSTGGGATLEFWEGKELPGISVLQNKQ
jgi:phosphoglycerate kinase